MSSEAQHTEMMREYQGQQQQQNRAAMPRNDLGQLNSFVLSLQQQGLLPPNFNARDPVLQSQVISLFSQMQAQGNSWGANQASQPNLDQILAQISKSPELAANLPTLLNSLNGGYGQHQPKVDPSLQDGGAGSYTQQLYGQGMGHLAEGKQGSEGLGHGDLEEDLEMRGGGVKCAKEKNRQAQRRFRERQKCLIQTLKDREEALRKQVEEQRHQIETLEKENQVLKVILQEKNKV